MRITSAAFAIFGAAALQTAAHAAEPAATIVEFFNAPFNKYFISATPSDWALLDQYASIG